MVLVIEALDNQFAASTDGNVNSGSNTSTFDYPPNSTSDLTITSNAGDPSPYIFSPGDTYDISFGGNGGTTLEDASVVRSDYISSGGDSGHAVVFEGTDPSGDLVQVVWTPEFDLEGWYFDNFSGGNPPQFYNTDTNSSSTYQMVCFAAGMRLLTAGGLARARDLRAGDRLLTLDNGEQEILWVGSQALRGWGRHAPVVFAPGSIGNSSRLVLSQQHRILLNTGAHAHKYGAKDVLVPALSFVNGDTVRVEQRASISYVHFLFERHELLTAAGVICESLYMGKVAEEILHEKTRSVEGALGADSPMPEVSHVPARPILSVQQGARLLQKLGRGRKAPPKMLTSPGRKNAAPYRVLRHMGLDMPGVSGQPAFKSLREVERA